MNTYSFFSAPEYRYENREWLVVVPFTRNWVKAAIWAASAQDAIHNATLGFVCGNEQLTTEHVLLEAWAESRVLTSELFEDQDEDGIKPDHVDAIWIQMDALDKCPDTQFVRNAMQRLCQSVADEYSFILSVQQHPELA